MQNTSALLSNRHRLVGSDRKEIHAEKADRSAQQEQACEGDAGWPSAHELQSINQNAPHQSQCNGHGGVRRSAATEEAPELAFWYQIAHPGVPGTACHRSRALVD